MQYDVFMRAIFISVQPGYRPVIDGYGGLEGHLGHGRHPQVLGGVGVPLGGVDSGTACLS